MKWIERADCRPPTKSTQPASIASSHGDIAKPHQHDERQQPKITIRYASFCSTL